MQVSGRLGWDGWIKPGTWNPITVTLRSTGTLEGRLVVDLPQEAGRQHIRVSRPVQVGAGGSRIVRFPALVRDSRRPPVLSLIRGQVVVASEELAVSPARTAATLLAEVGDSTGGAGRLADPVRRRAVAHLREEDLPEDAVAYASLDLLIVTNLNERILNEHQRSALREWVLHGGRVLVAGALPDGPLAAWLLPGTYTGRESVVRGVRSLGGGEVTIRQIQRDPGTQPIWEGAVLLGVTAARGLGSVTLWAPELVDVPPGSPLWRLALPAPPQPPELDELEVVSRAAFGPAAAGLLAYWILWVAAVALAGLGRGRWLAIPLVAALATAGLRHMSQRAREISGSPQIQALSVVVEGVEWTRARGVQVSAYGGRFIYTLSAGSHPAVVGGFQDAEVEVLPDRVRIEAKQRAGDRLWLWWDGVAPRRLEVELSADETELRTVGPLADLGEGTLFWQDRMIPLGRLQGRHRLDTGAWRPVEARHPGLRTLRAWIPQAGTIMKNHPVVVVEREGFGGGWWVVIPGRIR
ncbi:MAG: hypothetical protein QN163_09130 [Armatimonadota bacterium]|nr:hypothetical protein [Armatimonadota bacterium]MDR5697625.1 hypothetical protein [Armatimonadota bacterium]